MQKFESPAGFYSIQYPDRWKISSEENIVNIISSDEQGAVTISAFHSESGDIDMQAFLQMTRDEIFANSEPVVQFSLFQKTPLAGFVGEVRKKEDMVWRYWVVRGVHQKHVFVLITANDLEENFS